MSILTPARGSSAWDIEEESGGGLQQQKRDWEALQHFRDQSQAAQGRTMGEAGSNIANDRASVQGVLDGDYRHAMDLAQQAALGQGTSAAMAQQQAGQLAARHAQVAMANSAGGGRFAQAAAMQNAAQQSGQMQQSAAGMNQALRAQEMAAGRQQYAQLSDAYQSQLRGLRGSEIGMQLGNQSLNDQAALNWEAMRTQADVNNADWRMKNRQSAYAQGLAQTQAEDNRLNAAEGALLGGVGAAFKLAQKDDPNSDPNSDANVKSGIHMSDEGSRHLLSQWRKR